MLLHTQSVSRYVAVLLFMACGVVAATPGTEVAGLAIYTDTGRDIYIAGLLTADGQVPGNVARVSPPAAMQYRIATRRISDRGLSGTILLQAEVGAGERAPENVIDSLEQLKTRMQGALRSGDQFEIALSADNQTIFSLNGAELLALDDPGVFYYLLNGWVGGSASALMRDSLLAGSVDSVVMARYESLVPDQARVDAVAAWAGGSAAAAEAQVAAAPKPEPKPAPKPEPEPEPKAQPEPAAEPEPVAVAEPEPQVATADEVPAAAAVPESSMQTPLAEPEPQPAAPEQTVAVAEQPAPPKDAWVDSLDDREYQRLLNEYVATVMIKVFKSVRYPKRAVKREIEGQVEMLAEVDGGGKLLRVQLESSSGSDLLDDAAVEAIERAAPFPELSAVAKSEFLDEEAGSYLMLIPVKFQLN